MRKHCQIKNYTELVIHKADQPYKELWIPPLELLLNAYSCKSCVEGAKPLAIPQSSNVMRFPGPLFANRRGVVLGLLLCYSGVEDGWAATEALGWYKWETACQVPKKNTFLVHICWWTKRVILSSVELKKREPIAILHCRVLASCSNTREIFNLER